MGCGHSHILAKVVIMTNTPKASEFHAEILRLLGFDKQTPIQESSIPILAKGQSLFALAPTGSGKTLAFLIPLMQQLNSELQETQLLILAPTRELGAQISQVAEKVAKCLLASSSTCTRSLTIRTAFGGQRVENQKLEIEKKPHVVIATPGRAMDLINRETLKIDTLNAIVLDEADLMLAMGFEEQIVSICEHLPRHVQTALFSATEAELQSSLQERLTRASTRVDVRDNENSVLEGCNPAAKNNSLHQYIVAQTHQDKNDILVAFLQANEQSINNGIIFCQTRAGATSLCEHLRSLGFSTEELSGSLGQIERSTIMRRFKARGVKYLIATNIASRGIDIHDLSIVINYDLPSTPDEYIHRSGRSGRAGKTGRTLSLCLASAESFFRDIMDKNSIIPQKRHLKTLKPETDVEAQATPTKETETQTAPPTEAKTEIQTLVRFVKIHLNRGKSSKLRAGDVLGALVKEAGLLGEDVGSIFIFDHFTHVEVNIKKVKEVMQKISAAKIKNMTIKATEARELTSAKGKNSR